MKTSIITLLCFIGIVFRAHSQAKTRIHFLNQVDLVALQKSDKSYIKISNYTLVETAGDSLVFLSRNIPMTVKFEQGKNHYFLIRRVQQINNNLADDTYTVEEISERAFQLTLLTNKKSPVPYKKIVID
jgi:hypothetical protein